MSDWQVGDLALCVDRAPLRCHHGALHKGLLAPEVGAVSAVTKITRATFPSGLACCRCEVLVLANGANGLAQRFRKILPDKHEGCEPEFAALLQRIKANA